MSQAAAAAVVGDAGLATDFCVTVSLRCCDGFAAGMERGHAGALVAPKGHSAYGPGWECVWSSIPVLEVSSSC
jgi:hypothetical protein